MTKKKKKKPLIDIGDEPENRTIHDSQQRSKTKANSDNSKKQKNKKILLENKE